MSSNLKVNSLVPATGTAIGIGTTGGSIDFRCPATFGGNVTIGGTLTYDEVINIDSIGIVTARSGLNVQAGQLDVGSNIKLGNAGVVTATDLKSTNFVQVLGASGTSDKGLEVRSNSTQSTDTNQAIRVRNNSNSNTFSVSYKGYVNNRITELTEHLTTPTVYLGDSIIHSGDNSKIRFPANDTISFETAGSEKLRITTAGFVGIKTDDPQANLHVVGSIKFTNAGLQTNFSSTNTEFEVRQTNSSSWTNMSYATHPLIKWNWINGPGDHLYFGSGGNTAATDQMAMLLSDSHGFKVGKSGWDGVNNTNLSTEYFRINTSGYVNIGTGTAEQQLTVQNSAQHSLIRVIGNASSDTGVDFGDPADSDIGRIRYSNNGDYMTFRVNNINSVRFDNSGRVQIGGGDTPAQVGDGRLIVYSTDRLHPAIKPAGMSNNYANGWTLLGDNYQSDESQINLGLSYSSSSLVLSRGVKVSGSADNTYLSSQDSYAMRPCAIRMDENGAFNFLTTETNATTTTDSAVSLTEVFKIDRVGNIYQRISGRNLYVGASNQLRIGVQHNGDPNIEAQSGDLKLMKAGSTIMQLRADGFEMKQDIYFGTAGKGIVLGNTSNVDANTLDDYEEGSYTPSMGGSGWSYSRQVGYYRKVGTLVHVSIWITASGGPNNGTTATVSLPFTSYSASEYRGGISGSWDSANFNNTYPLGRNRSHINSNTATMQASFPFIDNGSWTSSGLNNAGLYDGFACQMSGSYIANA